MSRVSIQQMADRVSALLEQRLKATGPTLEARIKRAGSKLPRKVRDAAEALVQATEMTQSPKLITMIDFEAVAIAYDICVRHLNGLNKSERRMGLLLDAGARIAFALLAVAVLLVGVLYWRHFI